MLVVSFILHPVAITKSRYLAQKLHNHNYNLFHSRKKRDSIERKELSDLCGLAHVEEVCPYIYKSSLLVDYTVVQQC